MTENLCGSTGLLEVDENGTAYLTVRYYLDQFIGDVTFEERQTVPVPGPIYPTRKCRAERNSSATDIHDKYGFTDYRMQITDITSTFRGGAYVDPMGRSVIYYFQASNPVAGSGDFITSLQTSELENETAAPQTEAQEELLEEKPIYEEEAYTPEEEPEESRSAVHSVNGSGNVDDPVTGIPEKPTAGSGMTAAGTEEGLSASTADDEYHLETSYDLAAVSLQEARLLTAPMLEEAVGITGLTGDTDLEDLTSDGSVTRSTNQMIMVVLLGISGILLLRFTHAAVVQSRRQAAAAAKKADDRNGETEK